jgi:hypothetical protein
MIADPTVFLYFRPMIAVITVTRVIIRLRIDSTDIGNDCVERR